MPSYAVKEWTLNKRGIPYLSSNKISPIKGQSLWIVKIRSIWNKFFTFSYVSTKNVRYKIWRLNFRYLINEIIRLKDIYKVKQKVYKRQVRISVIR